MSSLADTCVSQTLSQHLRAATMPAHRRTEALLGNYAPLTTREGYRRFLTLMTRLHTRYAQPLDQASQLVGLAQRSQALLDALSADLHADVDLDENSVIVDGLSVCMGIAYVLEGSALGASVLVRDVSGQAHAYLTLLSTSTDRRWPAFKKALDTQPLDTAATVTAATDVFNDLAAMVPSR